MCVIEQRASSERTCCPPVSLHKRALYTRETVRSAGLFDQTSPIYEGGGDSPSTGWRRPMWCLKLQVIFRKSATNYKALFCGKRPIKMKHRRTLRHPVSDTEFSRYLQISLWRQKKNHEETCRIYVIELNSCSQKKCECIYAYKHCTLRMKICIENETVCVG